MADSPVRTVRFATADPGEARDFVDRTYGGAGLRVDRMPTDASVVSFEATEANEFVRSRLRLPADLSFDVEGRDHVVISTAVGGSLAVDRGDGETRYAPGDLYIGNRPEVQWRCATYDLDVSVVTLTGDLIRRAVERVDGPVWEGLATEPIGGGGALWARTVAYVDEILADPSAAASALVAGPAARLLAATVVAAFTEPAAETRHDRSDAHPATLRRAVSFIDDHASQDIGVADIARAAGVSARAVQHAFRRHLDTTPLAYLRGVRLHHAHRELAAATRGDGTTVTAVAFRWGFASLDRFTKLYRAEYGTTPSSTLRR